MELRHDITHRAELPKRNSVETLPSTVLLRKRNFARHFLVSRAVKMELGNDITPRTELQKQNFMSKLPSTVEMQNFMKTFPSERSCGSGTLP